MKRLLTLMLAASVQLVLATASTRGQEQSAKGACSEADDLTEQIEIIRNPITVTVPNAKVLTHGGSPVESAFVLIFEGGREDSAVWSGKTDSSGVFTLPTIRAGRYQLTICKLGFNTARFTIKVPKKYRSKGQVQFKVSPS